MWSFRLELLRTEFLVGTYSCWYLEECLLLQAVKNSNWKSLNRQDSSEMFVRKIHCQNWSIKLFDGIWRKSSLQKLAKSSLQNLCRKPHDNFWGAENLLHKKVTSQSEALSFSSSPKTHFEIRNYTRVELWLAFVINSTKFRLIRNSDEIYKIGVSLCTPSYMAAED